MSLRWLRDTNRFIWSSNFRLFLAIAHMLYLCFFVIFRWILNKGDNVIIYAVIHTYSIWSALIWWVVNFDPIKTEKYALAHAKANGEVDCEWYTFYILIFILGPGSLSLYPFRNRRNPCENSLTWRMIYYTPGLCLYFWVFFFPLVMDSEHDAAFWITYLIYVFVWCFILLETILAIWNLNYYMAYFSIFSLFSMLFMAPYYYSKAIMMDNPDGDIEHFVLEGVVNKKLSDKKYHDHSDIGKKFDQSAHFYWSIKFV